MKLEDAIKINEMQNALDSATQFRKRFAKAIRLTKKKQKMIAWSVKDIRVEFYSGPSTRKHRYEDLIKVYRRSALFYKEVKDKDDWEPIE